MTFASDERTRLAQLLLERGPDAPTLCAGWTTRDLAAHLWIREHRPDAVAASFVAPVAGHSTNVARKTEQRDFAATVRSWAKGAPVWNPMRLADKQANSAEHFVHLEDVRRGAAAQGGDVPAPREFTDAENEELYRNLRRMAPLVLRGSLVPVVLQVPGRAPITVARGQVAARTPVTVTGEAGELLLWAFGRDAVHVQVDGDLTPVHRSNI